MAVFGPSSGSLRAPAGKSHGRSGSPRSPVRPTRAPLEARLSISGPFARRAGAILEASWVALNRRMPEMARTPRPLQNAWAINAFSLFGLSCETVVGHGTCGIVGPSTDWGFLWRNLTLLASRDSLGGPAQASEAYRRENAETHKSYIFFMFSMIWGPRRLPGIFLRW